MSTKDQCGADFFLSESADFLAKNWGNLQRDYGGSGSPWPVAQYVCSKTTWRICTIKLSWCALEETLLIDRIPLPARISTGNDRPVDPATIAGRCQASDMAC